LPITVSALICRAIDWLMRPLQPRNRYRT